MSGDDLATALTTGGAAWMVLSISAILPILWAFTLVLHFARPYIVRFLGTLTLRFGGDVWWLGYVLFRDALMVLTLALSVIFLMPNLYIGLGLPLTAPLATVVLFWALVVKLTGDADDDPRTFRWVSVLLGGSGMVRLVHHLAMYYLLIFAVIHMYMVLREDVMSGESVVGTMINGLRTFKSSQEG